MTTTESSAAESSAADRQAQKKIESPGEVVFRVLVFLWSIPGRLLIGVVRFYQLALSPFLGKQCRFHPTCSQYFIECVKKYGAISGTLRGAWRICRCHPFHPGGYDPP